MAQPLLNLQPPPSFDFATPDDWPRWRRRFEQFRSASDLSTAAAGKQIGTLLYCLGEEAESVLISVNATADHRKDYGNVLITALANRGYGIAKTALPNHPPHVCVALLSRRLKSATWLLYSLLVAVQSATSLTLAP